MKSLEVQLNEAFYRIGELTGETIELKKVIHQKQITIAFLQRDWLLKEAKLPADSITRIHQAFEKATNNDGLKQAINVERKKVSQ